MSSAPTGFTPPKTNWQPADVVQASDLNRIEGNINAIETGARTLDPAQAPTGLVGTLRQFLDWFANRIKAITGETNWYAAPATTLKAAKSHIDAAAPHSGHVTGHGLSVPFRAAIGILDTYVDMWDSPECMWIKARRTNGSAEGSMVTVAPVCFTGKATLSIDWEGLGTTDSGAYITLAVSKNPDGQYNDYVVRKERGGYFARRVDSVDVSDLSGGYFVRVHARDNSGTSAREAQVKVYSITLI